MKSADQIRNKLDNINKVLYKKNQEYSAFDQISAQSHRGENLLAEIEQLNGKVSALEWVLQ